MGNNVTVACNPPQLEDILSFCGSRPVTRKRRKVKRGSSSQHAFLQLWRFHPDKNDENVVLCSAIRFTEFTEFSKDECYVALLLQGLPKTKVGDVEVDERNRPSIQRLLQSSAAFRSCSDLSFSNSQNNSPAATSNLNTRKKHTLQIFHGKRSSSLTKALALAKGFALQSCVTSNNDDTLCRLLSRTIQVPMGSVFENDLVYETQRGCQIFVELIQAICDYEEARDLPLSKWCSCQQISTDPPSLGKILNLTSSSSSRSDNAKNAKLSRSSSKPNVPTLSLGSAVRHNPSIRTGVPRNLNIKIPDSARKDYTPESKSGEVANTSRQYKRSQSLTPLFKLSLQPKQIQLAKVIQQSSNVDATNPSYQMSELESKEEKLKRFDPICSEITERLFLGSETVAKDSKLLKKHGITHILNCAGTVCPEYFPTMFQYRTLFLADGRNEDISCLFYDVIDWMNDALKNEEHKIFVHCQQGVSRSSAMLICYLMWERDQPFTTTHQFVKDRRGVSSPNTGFTYQLLEWYNRLHRPMQTNRLYRVVPHTVASPETLVMKKCLHLSYESLDPRGVFILHALNCVYLWISSTAPKYLVVAGHRYVERLQRFEKASKTVKVLRAGEETEEFWTDIGGSGDVKEVEEYDKEFVLMKSLTKDGSRRQSCQVKFPLPPEQWTK